MCEALDLNPGEEGEGREDQQKLGRESQSHGMAQEYLLRSVWRTHDFCIHLTWISR
jgi:hypothetical protein